VNDRRRCYDHQMHKPFAALVALALLLPTTGCLVRTRTSSRQSNARSCPPSYHWEGGDCVHNGRGRGRGKHHNDGPVIRDHD
jgi:hypothetical protein